MDDGYVDGSNDSDDGYDDGYNDGYDDRYNDDYDDGYDDSYEDEFEYDDEYDSGYDNNEYCEYGWNEEYDNYEVELQLFWDSFSAKLQALTTRMNSLYTEFTSAAHQLNKLIGTPTIQHPFTIAIFDTTSSGGGTLSTLSSPQRTRNPTTST